MLDAGCRLFDTSPMYGRAERVLGAALRPRRERAVVATKIWTPSVEEGRAQFRRQLRHFGGRVEVQQVHNLVNWRGHLAWLAEERREGTIGLLGATHYSAAGARRARDGDAHGPDRDGPGAVQPGPAGGGDDHPAAGRRARARRAGHAAARQRRASATGRRASELEPLGVSSWAEAVLVWALSDPRITAVIPATGNPAHAAANARAMSHPGFEPDERRHVEELWARR